MSDDSYRGRPPSPRTDGRKEAERRTERRYPPGPKGYQRSDERLREDISERIMRADAIDSSDVTVEVSGAKVVKEGTDGLRPSEIDGRQLHRTPVLGHGAACHLHAAVGEELGELYVRERVAPVLGGDEFTQQSANRRGRA